MKLAPLRYARDSNTIEGKSEPKRHHYIPIFYLKPWCGADGKLCEPRRWPDGVKAMRKAPKATAFERDLYKVPGMPEERAQDVEKRVMGVTDDWGTNLLSP